MFGAEALLVDNKAVVQLLVAEAMSKRYKQIAQSLTEPSLIITSVSLCCRRACNTD